MKLALANLARTRYINEVISHFAELGEDVALTGSNVCNMPIVQDGEEGVLEIVVKVVKKDYDECMQERTDYVAKVKETAEKKAQRAKEAEAKKAKAKAQKVKAD